MAKAKLTLIEKIRKVERRAWTEFNVRGRRIDSNIMDELREKWEDLVLQYKPDQRGADIYMCDPESNIFYHFGDVIA